VFLARAVALKNQNPAIWRLRGFRFGCGDLQPSQIAFRGEGLMILDELSVLIFWTNVGTGELCASTSDRERLAQIDALCRFIVDISDSL
jgi:hypothetical protein